ncbi:MAG: hypothetical protein JSV52_02400 [Candidatus Zixiibacteriota bacterium]|nr:MAG: hypothetical protein JSV52_02400 [candidate division Zixibacteria bacterium]
MVNNEEREAPLAALVGLLDFFRQRKIIDHRAEREGIEQHASLLTAAWDQKFPNFPRQYFPYTSFKGQYYRGRRDTYLKDIVVRMLSDYDSTDTTIVNAACVFGRHARYLASRLPRVRIVGMDIQPAWYWAYRLVRGFRFPDNFSFVRDNIFAPKMEEQPVAVVFFGACGSVTDGAIDYAINIGARYLMFRTCCHDNIGGNLSVIKRFNNVNRFFRLKNWSFGRMIRSGKYPDYYFSDKYPRTAYPRSESAKSAITTDEMLEVARYSGDSDICRAIIDLDRYLYLIERGFKVVYQGELFVAEREEHL